VVVLTGASILDFRFWIEEKGHHGGFFNPKSKIQNEFLRDFERFLRACALRSANLLNKADLARDVGIAPSTANHWLSTLEASGQVALLEPWFSNRTKSIIKSPKLYLADTGLLCALLNIRSEAR